MTPEEAIEAYLKIRLSVIPNIPVRRFTKDELFSFLIMPASIVSKKCESSNITEYGYDEHSRVLRVAFKNGGDYRYLAVPVMAYNLLEKAESKGSYINSIKTRYMFVQWK